MPLLAPMDDDVEVVTRIAPMQGGFHGHDGVRRWWENMLTTFPDFDSPRNRRAAGVGRAAVFSYAETAKALVA